MRFPTRATITYLLAGLFCLVSGVGEAWHLIPGSGHAVELPGGFLFLGVANPKSTAPSRAGSSGAWRPEDDSIPCSDEDECLICRLCAQGSSKTESPGFWLALAVVHPVVTTAPLISPAPVFQPFDARAPPIG
jgi:hypothetical protein